jgi:hypothetical protein
MIAELILPSSTQTRYDYSENALGKSLMGTDGPSRDITGATYIVDCRGGGADASLMWVGWPQNTWRNSASKHYGCQAERPGRWVTLTAALLRLFRNEIPIDHPSCQQVTDVLGRLECGQIVAYRFFFSWVYAKLYFGNRNRHTTSAVMKIQGVNSIEHLAEHDWDDLMQRFNIDWTEEE